jgi:hypothetical protein
MHMVRSYFSLLEAGQIEHAEKVKARIEDAQRSRSTSTFIPKWFKQDGNCYLPRMEENSLHSYWKKRAEHWNAVEFVPLW